MKGLVLLNAIQESTVEYRKVPEEYTQTLEVNPVLDEVNGVANMYLLAVFAIFDVIKTDNLFKPMLCNMYLMQDQDL